MLAGCPDLRHLVLVGDAGAARHAAISLWPHGATCSALAHAAAHAHRVIDTDMVAILYTSGSTGQAQGRRAVAPEHGDRREERRAVPREPRRTTGCSPCCRFSFDYGFSQLTTAFLVGASVVAAWTTCSPRDVVATRRRRSASPGSPACRRCGSSSPTLPWPADVDEHLRYITNSGGAMPGATLQQLRAALPQTQVFLMYGLTEAFRSTYLPPDESIAGPDSIGKAIPNAEILVVRPDGTLCAPDEPGELVHRGALVSLGYWNDPAEDRRALQARAGPATRACVLPEIAVWSGDTVRTDEKASSTSSAAATR